MRAMFTSRFGKEFVARGVELRNNCRVNTKVDLKFKILNRFKPMCTILF